MGHIDTGLVTTTRAGLIGPGTHVVGVVVCPPQCPIWDNYSATMTTKFNVRCDGHNGSECDSSHTNSSSAQASTGQRNIGASFILQVGDVSRILTPLVMSSPFSPHPWSCSHPHPHPSPPSFPKFVHLNHHHHHQPTVCPLNLFVSPLAAHPAVSQLPVLSVSNIYKLVSSFPRAQQSVCSRLC